MTCVVTARFAAQCFDSLLSYDWNHNQAAKGWPTGYLWERSRIHRSQRMSSPGSAITQHFKVESR